MEYIVIQNGRIISHGCGGDLPDGATPIPDGAPVVVGDLAGYYLDGWRRKSEAQLIREGYIPMPAGKTWADYGKTCLRDMTDAEKYETGAEEIPRGMKLENGELVNLSAKERYETGLITEAEYAEIQRRERDSRINAVQWRVERYRGQSELGRETDDSEADYKRILAYIQTLRDLPAQEGFPAVEMPEL